MTPKQKNALTYLYGQTSIMRDMAHEKYRDGLKAAYKSKVYGIPDKRKTYRSLDAQVKGLREKLRDGK